MVQALWRREKDEEREGGLHFCKKSIENLNTDMGFFGPASLETHVPPGWESSLCCAVSLPGQL